MQHSFDIDIAKDYGIIEAILLNNMWFWIEKNKANGTNYYDGYYWTYNSTRAFSELFPYASQRKIQNALKHLIDEDILQTGNYNKLAYDRTLWYAFTKKGECIMQKREMDYTKKENGLYENVQPIPNINTNDKTTNINTNNKKERKKETSYDEIINSMIENEEIKELLYEFIKMRKLKKKPLTDRALKIQINKLFKLSKDTEEQKQIIDKTIVACWDEFYALRKEYNNDKYERPVTTDYSEFDR